MVLRSRLLLRCTLMALAVALLVSAAGIAAGIAGGLADEARANAQTVLPAAATALTHRALDPVILTGLVVGAPAGEVYVYRYAGGAWEPIPYQIDRVSPEGDYTADSADPLDANDELVFMAADMGVLAPAPISETLPVEGKWFEVKVSDPLYPSEEGWVYIFRSTAAVERSAADYVSFDAASARVTTDTYVAGWAADHNGLGYLSLFGSANLLDRTKLRLVYRIGGGVPQAITENGNAIFPVADVVLIKDGPVRVITSRSSAVSLAYQSLMRTLLQVDLSGIPGVQLITVDEVRSSTDLASGVTGTYYDENNAAGMAIDGAPDAVSETPFTAAWRQVSSAAGSMLQVADLSGLGGFPRHYYLDDATLNATDTGDGQSHGDSGFKVINPSGRVFKLDSYLYFLPGSQENRGAEFAALHQTAVTLTKEEKGQDQPIVSDVRIFLPLLNE